MGGKKKTILTAVILLVIILAVVLVFKYTTAGDKIKDLVNPAFRVEYNGKEYDGGNNVIVLPTKGQVQFKVKGAESYKVALSPNVMPETDITYEIDNTVYSYSQADLSKVFISSDSIKNGSFYFNCIDDYSLENVLSKVHGGAEIKLNGKIECPYMLTFTANNKTVSFIFNGEIRVELSESNITF